MKNQIDQVIKNRWQELLLKLEADFSRGMTSFVDEDLNLIGQFLHEHRDLIPQEKYSFGIEILNACVKKIWTGENTKLMKGLLN